MLRSTERRGKQENELRMFIMLSENRVVGSRLRSSRTAPSATYRYIEIYGYVRGQSPVMKSVAGTSFTSLLLSSTGDAMPITPSL